MDNLDAVSILAALGQPTRLDAFRLLVREGVTGMPAGDIADALAVPRNTMSSHLARLARAGLIDAERDGTRIYYRPNFACLTALVAFLLEGCCGGKPELCESTITQLKAITLGLDMIS